MSEKHTSCRRPSSDFGLAPHELDGRPLIPSLVTPFKDLDVDSPINQSINRQEPIVHDELSFEDYLKPLYEQEESEDGTASLDDQEKRDSLEDIFGSMSEISIQDQLSYDSIPEEKNASDDEFIDAEQFIQQNNDSLHVNSMASWAQQTPAKVQPFPPLTSPGEFFQTKSAPLRDLQEQYKTPRAKESEHPTNDDTILEFTQDKVALTDASLRKLQKKFESCYGTREISDKALEKIEMDVAKSTSQVVKSSVQSAMAMTAPERLNLGWKEPLNPRDVVDTAIDATYAVNAMSAATSRVQKAVSHALRLSSEAAKAVETALAAEAMAVADHCRLLPDDTPIEDTPMHRSDLDIQRAQETIDSAVYHSPPSSTRSSVSLQQETKHRAPLYHSTSEIRPAAMASSKTQTNDGYVPREAKRKAPFHQSYQKHKEVSVQTTADLSESMGKWAPFRQTIKQRKLSTRESDEDDQIPIETMANGDAHVYHRSISYNSSHSSSQSRVNPTGSHRSSRHQKKVATERDSKQRQPVATRCGPLSKPRPCRRILCNVGTIANESFWFRNLSNEAASIYPSLIPLSTGCQQVSISPRILNLEPNESGTFVVTFTAQIAGPLSAILQFSSVSSSPDTPPYEVILDAVAKRPTRKNLRSSLASELDQKPIRRRELQENSRIEQISDNFIADGSVHIYPTFLRFKAEHCSTKGAIPVTLMNQQDKEVEFVIESEHDHIKIEPRNGRIEPHGQAIVYVWPRSRPVGRNAIRLDGSWSGSITISGSFRPRRMISVVFDSSALEVLSARPKEKETQLVPAIADTHIHCDRSERKGLYFSTQKVKCGPSRVGEKRITYVKLCNGSMEPLTVFVQHPRAPFAIRHSSVTLHPRSYVNLPVEFQSKRPGKFSTTIRAFSMSQTCSSSVRVVEYAN